MGNLKLNRVVLTGGPGTGKSSLITQLKDNGYYCFEEVSRSIISEARKEGIDQLFLSDPLLFSQKLMEGRQQQYRISETQSEEVVFFDRGIPDILAYMDYKGEAYPESFEMACRTHFYNAIYILPPWEDIFVKDEERYESFEQSLAIHQNLLATYQKLNYDLIEVPFGPIDERVEFIIQSLNLKACIP